MGLYTVTFSAVAVSAAQDLFEIVAPANARLLIHEIRVGQYSDFGDAQSEILSIKIVRGDTVSGSGGSTATPRSIEPWGGTSAVTSVEINNTTVANTSGVDLIADTFNVAAGWWWDAADRDKKHMRIGVEKLARLCVRITAPADALTMNGTLVYEEVGR